MTAFLYQDMYGLNVVFGEEPAEFLRPFFETLSLLCLLASPAMSVTLASEHV